MNELVGASAALASLLALTEWARTVPNRAWGDGAIAAPRAYQRACAVTVATLALQSLAAMAAAGPTAGVALVLASWMVLGWLLVLSMNQWPEATLRWAWRLGAVGGAGCVWAWLAHLMQLWRAPL